MFKRVLLVSAVLVSPALVGQQAFAGCGSISPISPCGATISGGCGYSGPSFENHGFEGASFTGPGFQALGSYQAPSFASPCGASVHSGCGQSACGGHVVDNPTPIGHRYDFSSFAPQPTSGALLDTPPSYMALLQPGFHGQNSYADGNTSWWSAPPAIYSSAVTNPGGYAPSVRDQFLPGAYGYAGGAYNGFIQQNLPYGGSGFFGNQGVGW